MNEREWNQMLAEAQDLLATAKTPYAYAAVLQYQRVRLGTAAWHERLRVALMLGPSKKAVTKAEGFFRFREQWQAWARTRE